MIARFHFDRLRILLCLLVACVLTSRAVAEDQRPVVDDSKFGADKAAADKLPTLFLVGDSTLKSDGALRGWAQEIGGYFDPAKINVINRAIGGRSSRTFQTEGKWDKVMGELKPGDFVIVQFGHNDNGNYQDPAAKGRPSIRSDGEETAEAVKSDGVTMETIHTFGWYMRKYVTDGKAKGATVILASMVPHKIWKDGKISRGERDTFVKWTRDDAKTTGAAFIDLNELVAMGYEKIGKEKVDSFFADARTHTSVEGARYTASVVVGALKALDPNPLAAYFSKAAAEISPATLPAESSDKK